MAQWPSYFAIQENHDKKLMAYVMGKAEGDGNLWHGHVTALTVAPEYRRMGLARSLMELLEEISVKFYDTYFVDLFVRKSNSLAIAMYTKFGYTVYRTVLKYYTGMDEEDAYGELEFNVDMRRAMPRDKEKLSIIPLTHPITPDQLEW